MSQMITANELTDLNEFELRSKFFRLTNDLIRSTKAADEIPLQLASLENVERELARKMAQRKGPRLG